MGYQESREARAPAPEGMDHGRRPRHQDALAAWRMSLPTDLATSPPAALAPLTVCAVEAAPWTLVEACMLAVMRAAFSSAAFLMAAMEPSTEPLMSLSWMDGRLGERTALGEGPRVLAAAARRRA